MRKKNYLKIEVLQSLYRGSGIYLNIFMLDEKFSHLTTVNLLKSLLSTEPPN